MSLFLDGTSQERKLADQYVRYGEKGEEFLGYLRQFGHVTYAANMTGLTRRTFYDRRAKYPEFAEAWDDAIAAFEEELTHRVVQTALEMGTGKWVPAFLRAPLTEVGKLDDFVATAVKNDMAVFFR